MQAPTWQNALSLGNMISVGTMLIAVGSSYAVLNYRMDQAEKYRIERSAQTDGRFADLGRATAQIPQLAYRMDNAEAQLRSLSERLDASFRAIGERLDRLAEAQAAGNQALSAQINGLDRSVAVITQRLEERERRDRASLSNSRFAETDGNRRNP